MKKTLGTLKKIAVRVKDSFVDPIGTANKECDPKTQVIRKPLKDLFKDDRK